MTNLKSDAESSFEDIPELERDMEKFKAMKAACEQSIKDFMAKENPKEGVVFAKEIFELQQEKLRLEVEAELRRKKINRIKLGMSQNADPSCGGLL